MNDTYQKCLAWRRQRGKEGTGDTKTGWGQPGDLAWNLEGVTSRRGDGDRVDPGASPCVARQSLPHWGTSLKALFVPGKDCIWIYTHLH